MKLLHKWELNPGGYTGATGSNGRKKKKKKAAEPIYQYID